MILANGKNNGPLAVVVFVHGEDFAYGAGHPYDPSMFVSQMNVIVVTMNYRVGVLGFLNANADGYFKSPANFALLDIIAALHWTQHRKSFGKM
ncbi:Neuroligin-1 [Orchesella cincta]|uniref:Neuroligin-1 n=1 Tax=Orchesella cincta TaxID=48709 RepID=A0A1D2NKP9_ORCCI|nr:Neuroligin-1 [Orchesella cincta]